MEELKIEDSLLLAVSCSGLRVSSDANLPNSGLFSNLYKMAVKNPVAKNEKRFVKISQSEPFIPAGRPPNLNYSQVYASEIFEDVVEFSPSLVAKIRTLDGMESNIRITVHYSSSLTSGKDVLLAQTTFAERELIRACFQNGSLTTSLTSEYCSEAKATILIISKFDPVVDPAILPITNKVSPKNPIHQTYVYYTEKDQVNPNVDVLEQCWEPKFSGVIANNFLENCINSLEFSIKAWQKRKELERMRQGRFSSDLEAYHYGWHVITVQVRGVRMVSTNENSQPIIPLSDPNNIPVYTYQFPFTTDHIDVNNLVQELNPSFPNSTDTPLTAQLQHRRSNRDRSLTIGRLPPGADNTPNKSMGKFFSGGTNYAVKKFDESLPSTFVEIFVENKNQHFVDYVGRTNTEYNTPFPMYGALVNHTILKKSTTDTIASAIPVNDTVQVITEEKEYVFHKYESFQRGFVPKRWKAFASKVQETRGPRKSIVDSEEPTYTFSCLQGKSFKFKKYVPSPFESTIRLDLCFDLGSDKKRRVATCQIPITQDKPKQTAVWVPLHRIIDPTMENIGYDTMEVLIDYEIQSSLAALVGMKRKRPAPEHMREVNCYQRKVHGRLGVSNNAYNSGGAESIYGRSRSASGDTIASPPPPVSPTPTAPRLARVSVLNIDTENDDYQQVIADCYEWMWMLGFNGYDPLMYDELVDWESYQHPTASVLPSPPPPVVPSSSSKVPLPPLPPSELLNTEKDSDDEEEVDPISTQSPAVSTERSVKINLQDGFAMDSFRDALNSSDSTHKDPTALDANIFVPRQTMFEEGIPNLEEYCASDLVIEDEEIVEIPSATSLDDLPSASSSSAMYAEPSSPVPTNIPFSSPPSVSPKLTPGVSAKDLMTGKSSGKTARRRRSSLSAAPTFLSKSRLDFPYPLQWMDNHINELQKVLTELQSVAFNLKKKLRAQKIFRASVFKKEVDYQVLPINLHYQVFGVRRHHNTNHVNTMTTNSDTIAANEGTNRIHHLLPHNPYMTEVVHSVTCGAMSPHYLEHKLGGLFLQENKLVTVKDDITRKKYLFLRELTQLLTRKHTAPLPHNPSIDLDMMSYMSEKIGKSVLSFEQTCITIGRRRLFAISQALSIAVNAFLLKLHLLLNDQVPVSIGEGWLDHGFLIVFEGLLSVVGKEKSMLEDTISAVDALKTYPIRIITRSATMVQEEDEEEYPSIECEMVGREVVITLGADKLAKLPSKYQYHITHNKGAIIVFYPVLFSQGIDIQQTMVTTFGSSADNKKAKGGHGMKSVDLQSYINNRARKEINIYCYKVQPINRHPSSYTPKTAADYELEEPRDTIEQMISNSGANPTSIGTNYEIHPLVQDLYQSIANSSPAMKNVDLLLEVERICLILGGIRVTFCKSGKDRTGMAVTLEQSRQLGERYHCGLSTARILKDANLMRVHGCRLAVAEKNIGKPVYSINMIQAQFLPVMFRPPAQVCEDILKKDNS